MIQSVLSKLFNTGEKIFSLSENFIDFLNILSIFYKLNSFQSFTVFFKNNGNCHFLVWLKLSDTTNPFFQGY